MPLSDYQTAADTLALLEERLRHVDYILHGDRPVDTTNTNSTAEVKPTVPAAERLRRLERNLASLAAKSASVSDALSLQKQHPSLFHPNPQTSPAVPPAPLAALILAHANLFQATSTQLQHLSSQSSVPDLAVFVKLIALQPRIAAAQTRQREQARQFAELRLSSARLVEKWYEGGVLGMGEKWAAWEEKLRECEILVRRREAREKREREGIA